MESIIEELYYGNLCLSERDFRSGSEFAKGFKLGLRLTAETFISGNGEQDLTSE